MSTATETKNTEAKKIKIYTECQLSWLLKDQDGADERIRNMWLTKTTSSCASPAVTLHSSLSENDKEWIQNVLNDLTNDYRDGKVCWKETVLQRQNAMAFARRGWESAPLKPVAVTDEDRALQCQRAGDAYRAAVPEDIYVWDTYQMPMRRDTDVVQNKVVNQLPHKEAVAHKALIRALSVHLDMEKMHFNLKEPGKLGEEWLAFAAPLLEPYDFSHYGEVDRRQITLTNGRRRPCTEMDLLTIGFMVLYTAVVAMAIVGAKRDDHHQTQWTDMKNTLQDMRKDYAKAYDTMNKRIDTARTMWDELSTLQTDYLETELESKVAISELHHHAEWVQMVVNMTRLEERIHKTEANVVFLEKQIDQRPTIIIGFGALLTLSLVAMFRPK